MKTKPVKKKKIVFKTPTKTVKKSVTKVNPLERAKKVQAAKQKMKMQQAGNKINTKAAKVTKSKNTRKPPLMF